MKLLRYPAAMCIVCVRVCVCVCYGLCFCVYRKYGFCDVLCLAEHCVRCAYCLYVRALCVLCALCALCIVV